MTENKATYTAKTPELANRMKAIEYTPADMAAWNKLTEKEQHAMLVRKENEREMVAARATVRKFQDTKDFSALPKDVQDAIVRVCGKTGGGAKGGPKGSPFMDTLKELFPKVKAAVTELDIFMKTKMGRGEFRKRVREALKSAAPAERMWIEFNDEKESWVLLAVGAEMPAGFKGKDIE